MSSAGFLLGVQEGLVGVGPSALTIELARAIERGAFAGDCALRLAGLSHALAPLWEHSRHHRRAQGWPVLSLAADGSPPADTRLPLHCERLLPYERPGWRHQEASDET
jgi:hypothetical protein